MSHSDGPRTVNGEARDALDYAIDCTLREIVAQDPPERLTARVMARIASRDDSSARRTLRGRWPVVMGLAAAAAIVIAVALWPDRTQPAAPHTASTTPSSIAPQPPQQQAPRAPQQASASVTQTPRVRVERSARRTATDERVMPALEPSIAIAPLDAPEVIALPTIAPESVTLTPLEVPKMEIAPIDATGRTPDGE